MSFPKEKLFGTEKSILMFNRNYQYGKQLYQSLINLHENIQNNNNMSSNFHKHVLKNGTFKDKISCWLLRIQESHLTRLSHFDEIMKILSMDIKRHAIYIIPLINDLFLNMTPKRKIEQKNRIKNKQKEIFENKKKFNIKHFENIDQIKKNSNIPWRKKRKLIRLYIF